MRGFSYLYSVFLIGFLSSIVIGYFTSVGTSYLSQKRILNERYYDSLSREFLSKVLNQVIKKINFYPEKIESISDIGIFDNSLYFEKIGEITAKVRLLVNEENVEKGDDFNKIRVKMTLYSIFEIFNINKIHSVKLEFVIFSGKLPFNLFFQKENAEKVNFFFPYHNSSFYTSKKYRFNFDSKKAIARVLNIKEEEIDIRKLLKMGKTDIPIVDGFYLGEIDSGAFLYLKGDLDNFIIGIDGDYQFIFAKKGENCFLLKYIPGDNNYTYLKNDESQKFNIPFSGTIFIEGNVNNFSAGKIIGNDVMESSDAFALKDRAVLNIFIGGGFKIKSSLKYENISIKKGKFVREKTKLNLIQSKGGLFFDNERESEVCFEFENDNTELHGNYYLESNVDINRKFLLFGTLYSKYYFLSHLPEITEDPLNYLDEEKNDFMPQSEKDITIIKKLKIEKIEEEFNV